MSNIKDMTWTKSNKKLIKSVAEAISKKEGSFICPLFNTKHYIGEKHISNGIEFWRFSYRGHRYCLTKQFYDKWNSDFWVLCLIVKSNESTTLKRVVMLREDLMVYVNLNFDGTAQQISFR